MLAFMSSSVLRSPPTDARSDSHKDAQPAADVAPGERVPLRRNDVLLILGFWTFVALLTAANALIDPRGRGLQPVFPSSPLTLALIESLLWAAITPFVFWLVSRYGVERTGRVVRVLLFLFVGVALAILIDQIVGYFRLQVLFVPRRPPAGIEPIIRLRRLWFMNEFIVYIAVLAAAYARDYFLRYRARREEAAHLQAHTAHLQAQLADARLAALQAQVNPHFLFNTLHAVSALVERDPRGVRRMIARLSELLRTSLEAAGAAEVTLAQELAFLRRYLEIMQIRFQGRLEVDIRVPAEVEGALVPNLILQPLVENAFKHGIDNLEGVGRIAIEARRDGADVVLSVQDNGPGITDPPPAITDPPPAIAEPPPAIAEPPPARVGGGEGVGLRNTRARLEQLYGSMQSMTLQSPAQGGLRVQISLPYHTNDDLRTAEVPAQR